MRTLSVLDKYRANVLGPCRARAITLFTVFPWRVTNTFFDWRRTCHVSLVKASWRPKANKTSWRPRATTTWTFDSHMIRSCTFETAANLFASRVRQKIFFTQSWQLNGFKQELNKKLSSFYAIKAPNLLTRRPTVPWERWEISAKSKIWTKLILPRT